jgi:hypothetical protein
MAVTFTPVKEDKSVMAQFKACFVMKGSENYEIFTH